MQILLVCVLYIQTEKNYISSFLIILFTCRFDCISFVYLRDIARSHFSVLFSLEFRHLNSAQTQRSLYIQQV